MTGFYNEIDPFAAQWLRNLIDAGHIAPGIVDERSIEDIHPEELDGFTQCHFFAGIGAWSLALRRAGWPDDEPVWTGSCPCQPFSSAGKGAGFSDERHLWPAFHHLIAERRPPVVFGEQVAGGAGRTWLALVRTDLEALGYAVGAADLCAAGVGAPHIRQRLYWVGHSSRPGGRRHAGAVPGSQAEGEGQGREPGRVLDEPLASGAVSRLADTRSLGRPSYERGQGPRQESLSEGLRGLEHANSAGSLPWREAAQTDGHGRATEPAGGTRGVADSLHAGRPERGPGTRNGSPSRSSWTDCDWFPCRDGKARPVEPGTFPLAHGVSSRVGRLRAYGNAIVPQVAQAFVEAYLQTRVTA